MVEQAALGILRWPRGLETGFSLERFTALTKPVVDTQAE
jgi:hypothetical protein